MLKLQILSNGHYYDLICPQEIKDEVRAMMKIEWWMGVNTHQQVDCFPKLNVWMKDNAYRELYVRVHHVPDVAKTVFNPKLSLQNIEEEMKKLQERIQQNASIDTEDLPDYGSA